MIGRKIPGAAKSKLPEYDGVFKMSRRVARQKRRAKRARKLRNGWMFGRKIRVGTQWYLIKYIDEIVEISGPDIFTVREEDGVEETYYAYSCIYPRREPKVKQPDPPGYDDVFKFFGDIADYNYNEVVFTFGNEPGSIPIDAKLSFIPPTSSNVTDKVERAKQKRKRKKEKQKERKKVTKVGKAKC